MQPLCFRLSVMNIKILAPFLIAVALFPPLPAQAAAPDCSRQAGSRPSSSLEAGKADAKNPIEHIVIIMQENHSFDNYFGRLNQPAFYGNAVDGITDKMSNPNSAGHPVFAHHEKTLCPADPGHSWNDMHKDWNQGANDNFVKVSGEKAIGYYDQQDIPFYYALANQFAISDRYFAPILTSTFSNRFYLLAGTSFGHIRNDMPKNDSEFAAPTIFETLDKYGISWRYYGDGKGYLSLFRPLFKKDKKSIVPLAEYERDLNSDHFPQVAFVESNFENDEDEHPNENIQLGQAWVAARVKPFMSSPYWKDSVLFLTYDEGGGFFDHVAPPAACAPDTIAANLEKNSAPGGYTRYGFRVPFIAISPYVKHHFVAHTVVDHSSILKFIETKFNLPALSVRDANANDMLEMFDFKNPVMTVPHLPEAVIDGGRTCEKTKAFSAVHGT